MHLKRFRAPTVAEAFEAARRELGPDPLVLGTSMVRVRGPKGWLGAREVEVTAAIERQVSEDRPSAQTDRQDGRVAVDGQVARLTASGLDPSVIDELTLGRRDRRRGLSSADLRRSLSVWAKHIATDEDEDTRARVEVFIGPAGAGKTTTVAKIAAQARVKNGQRFGLVSADAFRVGAIEQLRLYADIIGAPFVAARTPEELMTALRTGHGPLLVDTAGRSPRDDRANELMALLGTMGATPDLRVHLVVPAGSTPRQLGRFLDDHAPAAPRRIVLTKLDEADSIGPIVGVLRRRGLRVSYLGVGQHVPEDLRPATPLALASALMGETLTDAGHAA